jgi:hypothetical protein
MVRFDREEIEVLAYLIWKQQGCPEGRALEHWLEAEYLVHTRSFIHESDDAGKKP